MASSSFHRDEGSSFGTVRLVRVRFLPLDRWGTPKTERIVVFTKSGARSLYQTQSCLVNPRVRCNNETEVALGATSETWCSPSEFSSTEGARPTSIALG